MPTWVREQPFLPDDDAWWTGEHAFAVWQVRMSWYAERVSRSGVGVIGLHIHFDGIHPPYFFPICQIGPLRELLRLPLVTVCSFCLMTLRLKGGLAYVPEDDHDQEATAP